MNGRTVVIRYAKALYDVALQKKSITVVIDDLSNIEEILDKAPSIRDYCLKFHANHSSEMMFVETAFIPYVSKMTGEALRIAVRNGRLAAIPYLFKAFKKIIESETGITEVVLQGVREPEKSLEEIIEKKMEGRLKGKIKFNNVVVPELLGGVRILWNNRMIDLSVLGRLKKLRTLMKAV